MIISYISLFLVVFSAALSPLAETKTASNQTEEKIYVTKYGLELHAWLTRSEGNQKAPLLITLPMMGHTHESYEPLLEAMREYVESDTNHTAIMPYTLNFDLRGHGKSIRYKGHTLTYKDMRKPHWLEVPPEVAEMAASIIADTMYNIDEDNIIVVGASIGANTAMIMTEHLPGIKKVVMLSPGKNYRGLVPENHVKSFKGQMLIMVRKRDHNSRKASLYLQKFNEENCELRIYPERGHGTGIINNDPEPMAELVKWLFRR